MERIAGIGEMVLSESPNDVLKTYALGSCVAVIAYDAVNKKAGLIHIALPFASDEKSEKAKPLYYAKQGLPVLLNTLCGWNCRRENLRITVIGGASSNYDNDVFGIGEKNLKMVKNILDENRLRYQATEIGGNVSRTVEVDVASGQIRIRTQAIAI